MTQLIANGNAYSDDGSTSRDMQHGGFRSWLLPMLRDVLHDAAASTGNAESAGQSAQAAQQSAVAAALAAQAAEDALDAIENIGSGWTPVIGIAIDGQRMVLQIRDWTGGRGPKPATGYIGETGLVPNIGDGLNIRGAVSYNELTDKPTLGTAAALDVPPAAGGIATPLQAVRGDDPRLVGGTARGTLTLTTSQTLNRDATFGTATYVLVEAWGGGAGGNAYVNANGSAVGGEGGEYVSRVFRIEDLPASIVATIGAGGAGVTATSSGSFIRAPANSGGSTSFGALLTARGGLANLSSDANLGAYAPSKITTLAGKNGGDGGGSVPNSSTADRRLAPGPGGDSVYGGGGGGGAGGTGNPYMAGGTSVFGGAGGAGGYSTSSGAVGSPGAARGGGGGGGMVMKAAAAGDTATSGAGGRGEIKLTWW